MIVYKAVQVLKSVVNDPKPWEMEGRKGVTHSAKLAVFGELGDADTITLKAKSEDELKAQLAKYPVGKPAEIRIITFTPVFKQGDRRPAGYDYEA